MQINALICSAGKHISLHFVFLIRGRDPKCHRLHAACVGRTLLSAAFDSDFELFGR